MTAIPVTTLGGYLGAGKTTLVNAVLAGAHGRRIGVLVNDFGAVSIDAKLIVARDGDMATLANGCACCSVAGDLGEALDRLASAIRPDHILIEASGVADPARIAALARAPGLAPRAPVTLADAQTIAQRANDKFVGRLVRRQLAEAGLVVLTKCDLVDDRSRVAARDFVTSQSPDANVVETIRGQVAIELLLDRDAGAAPAAFDCAEVDDAAANFENHFWSSDKPIDPQRLRLAIAGLPTGVVRAKGIFETPDGSAFQVHRVNGDVEISPLVRPTAELRRAQFVFIARRGDLDRTAVDSAVNACVAS